MFGRHKYLAEHITINISETNNYCCDDSDEPNGTSLVLTTILNNNFQIRIMALVLNSNQQAQGLLSLTDDVTSNIVTATFSDVVATSDNEGVFTTVVNPDGSVTAKAVAAGSGNITVSATVSYTDSTNQPKTESKTVSLPVSVAQATADTTTLVLTFGTPTAQ